MPPLPVTTPYRDFFNGDWALELLCLTKGCHKRQPWRTAWAEAVRPGLVTAGLAVLRELRVIQLAVSEVSSMTKLVCREESSWPTNFTVTVLPLYAVRLNVFWTYVVFLLRLEYVASVVVVPPSTIWILAVS